MASSGFISQSRNLEELGSFDHPSVSQSHPMGVPALANQVMVTAFLHSSPKTPAVNSPAGAVISTGSPKSRSGTWPSTRFAYRLNTCMKCMLSFAFLSQTHESGTQTSRTRYEIGLVLIMYFINTKGNPESEGRFFCRLSQN